MPKAVDVFDLKASYFAGGEVVHRRSTTLFPSPLLLDETSAFHEAGLAADGKMRCLPKDRRARLNGRQYFEDATCSQRRALSTHQCEAPLFADEVAQGAECSAEKKALFPITGPKATSSYYHSFDGQCGAITTTGQSLYPFGAELAPQTFPLITRGNKGSGRLQLSYEEVPGGFRQAAGLWDSVLGKRCKPIATIDEKTRCVPEARRTDDFYLDKHCKTDPVHFSPCGKPNYFLVFQPLGCQFGYAIYDVGATIAQPTELYRSSYGSCSKVSAREIMAGSYFIRGNMVAPWTFELL